MKRTYPLLLLAAFLVVLSGVLTTVNAQPHPEGRWEGSIKLPGLDLGIVVQFERRADSLHGSIDIPMQMAKGLPLQDVGSTGTMVHFALKAGPGLANFAGTLAGDSITGIFTQANVRCPFVLRRAAPPAAAAAPTYHSEEVTIQSGGVSLAGTLTRPDGAGPFPAVVLLTGSGAQNRDEEIFGFAPFKILADSLTLAGFAVLRCDDRGIGGSTGDYAGATTDSFASDARAQVAYLAARKEIRKDAIGVLGHSEGAVAAVMLCAAHHDVAFAVLLAGPAVSGGDIILGQVERLARAGGASDSAVAAALVSQQQVYAAVRADTGWGGVRTMLLENMRQSAATLSPEQRASAGINDSVLAARVDVQLAAVQSTWFRRFVMYDPARDIAAITCPVLALFGSLDMQVPPDQNRPALESVVASARKANITIRTIPGANHLFQEAKTGAPTEYATLPKAFIAGLPSVISTWMSRIALH
ncbi:MAG: alpha/beta fold hydrolase [Ignavibacteriae bacterium]|nr:alpha/beta fold hydrolase [Ignavibacteriota bacterium]